jgi:hypothetical protein
MGDYDLDNRTIVVASVAGDAYTIASVRGVAMHAFVADDFLVFHTGGELDYHGDIRGHVPGSGDTSFLVSSDWWVGAGYPVYHYAFSPDRTRILAAKIPPVSDTTRRFQLYSVPLRGGEPQLLDKDWVYPGSYFTNPCFFDSQGRYAVYLSPRESDPQSYATWVVDTQNPLPRKLVDGFAMPLPATGQVLIGDTASDGRHRLRLADLASLRDRLSYTSNNQIIDESLLRGDRAILFSEYDGKTLQAKFMSMSHPKPVLLGAWEQESCRSCSSLRLQSDPTECFAVLNTDNAPGPGTRLVLLPE